ncbi:hypothetical protein ACFTTN_23575 [Streptomyces niveus]|uniref:hypothetical protein n=1 Tax=Streptomyces niveus TaxID=193462 RepID=UPI0036342ED2
MCWPAGPVDAEYAPLCGTRSETLGTSAPRAPYRRLRGVHPFAREAITDAVKHAAPSRIVIELAADGRSLTIMDDGQGGRPATPTTAPRPARVGVAAATASSHGVGMATMCERAELLEACLPHHLAGRCCGRADPMCTVVPLVAEAHHAFGRPHDAVLRTGLATYVAVNSPTG